MNNKLQSTISLCRRAGLLLLGFDQVKEAVQAGKVKAVFAAQDLSEKTKKEVGFFCEKGETPFCELPISMAEIKAAVGKGCGVLAVTEKGFAENLLKQGLAPRVKEED